MDSDKNSDAAERIGGRERFIKDFQVSDGSAIEAQIDKIITAHLREMARYRNGRHKLLGFFVGQAMRFWRGS